MAKRQTRLRKGSVTNIADARTKRDEDRQQQEEARKAAAAVPLHRATLDEAVAQHNDLQATKLEQLAASGSDVRASKPADTPATVQARESVPAPAPPADIAAEPSAAPKRQKASKPEAKPALNTAAENADEKPAPAKKPARVKKRNFNHEKVAALKAAIANGTYEINPQRIADKFIEQECPN